MASVVVKLLYKICLSNVRGIRLLYKYAGVKNVSGCEIDVRDSLPPSHSKLVTVVKHQHMLSPPPTIKNSVAYSRVDFKGEIKIES